MAQPRLDLNQEELDEIFNIIDIDHDGQIDKQEMACFIKVLMITQQGLSFKAANSYIHDHLY